MALEAGTSNSAGRRSSRRSSQTPAKFSPSVFEKTSPGSDKRRSSSLNGTPAKRRPSKTRNSALLSLTTSDGLPITSVLCTFCTGDEEDNRKGEFEALLTCSSCHESAHPSCLPMSPELALVARSYDWLCFSCKACQACKSRAKQSQILLCDRCDRGYHTFCLRPPLKEPPSGDWKCPMCCGDDSPGENLSSTGFDDVMPLHQAPKTSSSTSSDVGVGYRNPSSIIKRPKSSTRSQSASPISSPGAGRGSCVADVEKIDEDNEQVQRIRCSLASGLEPEHVDLFIRSYTASERQRREEQACWKDCVSSGGAAVSSASIRSVCLGDYEMETRFSSPYPDEFAQLHRLFLCSFCLVPAKSPFMLKRHMVKCVARYPPGKEIYRKQELSVFEVDGDCSKEYCQRLCLLAKLFLHHKTLYRQVEPFRFYVLTKIEGDGFHLVGYFSKEKESPKSYNVSCILVLPSYMQQGYGRLLVDLSYTLSQREGKTGSPERPLSDLGLVTYRSYWKSIILSHLHSLKSTSGAPAAALPLSLSIKALSQQTSIQMADLISTMQWMGILKYWRGNHIVLLNSTQMPSRQQSASKKASHALRSIDVKSLHWNPPAD